MRVFVDTNVVVDFMAEREPFFDDAVQFLSAQPFNPDVIITRDERGFNDFNVLVMTPADFVKKAKENRKNIH